MTLSEETTRSVNAFLDSYRTTFEKLDAPAIAEYFAFPLHVTQDGQEIGLAAIATRQDWIQSLERLLGLYRAIDVSTAGVLDLTVSELSPRLVQALVHWALFDGAGRSLYDFEAIYTLAQFNDMFLIAAIAHNEMPRYRECFKRIQALR